MGEKKDIAPKNAIKHPNAIGIKEGFGYTLILILTIIHPLSKKRLEPIREELMKRRAEVDEV